MARLHPSQWGQDPLFWSCVKLTVADLAHRVAENTDLPETFSLLGHPISRVEIRGVIVRKQMFNHKETGSLSRASYLGAYQVNLNILLGEIMGSFE